MALVRTASTPLVEGKLLIVIDGRAGWTGRCGAGKSHGPTKPGAFREAVGSQLRLTRHAPPTARRRAGC